MLPSSTTKRRLAAALLLAATGLSTPEGLAKKPVPSVTATSNLAFGRFVAGAGGAVSVAPNGMRSASGGVVLLASSATPASFTVAAATGQQLIVTLPVNGSTALVSGADRMPVTGFASNLPPGGVLTNGTQSVSVGASLQVAPRQPSGIYSGTFQVTVEYQ